MSLITTQLGAISLPALAAVPAGKLQGVVYFDGPVLGANIKVVDKNGNVVAEQNQATNADGYFSVDVPLQKGLRVEARGEALEGTLVGAVEKGFTHVNVITTVTERYRALDRTLSKQAAEQRVLAYLGLPGLLDTGFSSENPYLTSFSPRALAQAAALNGGFDRYVSDLAEEMQKDPQATRSFPGPVANGLQLGNPAFWIGEKLLAGVVGAIGSQLFSKFMDGIGFPDQTTQIFNLLNQVMARLAEIQNQLNKVEQAIKQANYDIRASALWKEYQFYATIMRQMKEINLIANANLDAQGKIKDPKIAEQVKAAGADLTKKLVDMDLHFISNVHAEMITEGTITPLPKIFAEVKNMDGPLVNQDYLNTVYGQLEQYRSFQAVATALYVDAVRSVNTVKAEADLKVALQYINEEKVVFPDQPVFKRQDVLSAISENRAFFDKSTNLIWMTKYYHVNTCGEMQPLLNPGAKERVPNRDEVDGLLTRTGTRGYRWSDAVKKLGFSKEDADNVKMITWACVEGTPVGTLYAWWGNDQQGPYSNYVDPQGQYDNVRNQKGVKGIDMMIVSPLR